MQNKNDKHQHSEQNVNRFDDGPSTSHKLERGGSSPSDHRPCSYSVDDLSHLPWNMSYSGSSTTLENNPPTAMFGGGQTTLKTSSTASQEEKYSGGRPSIVDEDPILQLVFRPFQQAATSNVEKTCDQILYKVFTIFPSPEKCTEDGEWTDENFQPTKSYNTQEFDQLTKAQRRVVLASHTHSFTTNTANRISSISERSEEEHSVGRRQSESEKMHGGEGVERKIIRDRGNGSVSTEVNQMPNADVTTGTSEFKVENNRAPTIAEKAVVLAACDTDPLEITGANKIGSCFKMNSKEEFNENESDNEKLVKKYSGEPIRTIDDEMNCVESVKANTCTESPPMKSYEDDPVLREVFHVFDRNVNAPLRIEIPLHQAPLRNNASMEGTNEWSVCRDSPEDTEALIATVDKIFVDAMVESGDGVGKPIRPSVDRVRPLSTSEALWSPSDSGFVRGNGSDSSSMNADIEDNDYVSPHIQQLDLNHGSEYRSHFQVFAPAWSNSDDTPMESSGGGPIHRSAPLAIPLQYSPKVVTYLTDSGVYLESDVGSLTVEFPLIIDQKPAEKEDAQKCVKNEDTAVAVEGGEFSSDSIHSSDLHFSKSFDDESREEAAGAVGWRPIETVDDGLPSLYRNAAPDDDDDFDKISLIKQEFDSLKDPQTRLLSMLSEGSAFCPIVSGNSAEEATNSSKHSSSTDPSVQSWAPLENVPVRLTSTTKSDGSDIVGVSKLQKDSMTKPKKFSEDIHRIEAEKPPQRQRIDLLEVIKSYNSAVSTVSPSRPPRQLVPKRLSSLPEERNVEEEEKNGDDRRDREENIELQFKSATLGQLCVEMQHVILTDNIEQCQLSAKAVAKTRPQKQLAKSASATEFDGEVVAGETTSSFNLACDRRPVVELARVDENTRAAEPKNVNSYLKDSDPKADESKSISPTLVSVTIRSLPTGGVPNTPSLPKICEERWSSVPAEPVKSSNDYGILLSKRHFRESTTVVGDSRQEAIAYTSTATRYSTNYGSYRSIVNIGQLAAEDEWSFADVGIPLVFDRPQESGPLELKTDVNSSAIPYNYCNIALEKDDSSRIVCGITENREFDEGMNKFLRSDSGKETGRRLSPEREEDALKEKNAKEILPQIHHDIFTTRKGEELTLNPPSSISGKDDAHRLVMEHTNITEIVYSSNSRTKQSNPSKGMLAGKKELFTSTSIRINSFAPDELFTDLNNHRSAMSELKVKRVNGKSSSDDTFAKYYVISKKKENDDENSRKTTYFDQGAISTVNGLERRDFGVQTEADPMLDTCCRLRLMKPKKRDVTKQMLAENGMEKKRNGAIPCHEHEFLVCRNPRHNLRHDHCDPTRLYTIRRTTTEKSHNNGESQSIERLLQSPMSFPHSYSRSFATSKNPSMITVDSRNITNSISVHHTPGSDWIVSSVCKTLPQ